MKNTWENMDWKNNQYYKHLIELLKKGKSTPFLNPQELETLTTILKKEKIKYQIWKPFEEASHTIIYIDEPQPTCVLRIHTKTPLRHQDIMGSLYHLQIESNTFGDILITPNYDIVILASMKDYLLTHLTQIKNINITIEALDTSVLKDYQPVFINHTTVVPSLRIDAVLSRIVPLSRKDIVQKIHQKEVLVNEKILEQPHYILKENDRFSIRKYGKYRFKETQKTTKKDNLVISYDQYV